LTLEEAFAALDHAAALDRRAVMLARLSGGEQSALIFDAGPFEQFRQIDLRPED
jgi:hypothetical protein